MKLLFVTGGEDCECKGSGKVERRHDIELSTFAEHSVSRTAHIYVKEPCPCVKAHEATVEELVDHGVHKATERSGSVVPKE